MEWFRPRLNPQFHCQVRGGYLRRVRDAQGRVLGSGQAAPNFSKRDTLEVEIRNGPERIALMQISHLERPPRDQPGRRLDASRAPPRSVLREEMVANLRC